MRRITAVLLGTMTLVWLTGCGADGVSVAEAEASASASASASAEALDIATDFADRFAQAFASGTDDEIAAYGCEDGGLSVPDRGSSVPLTVTVEGVETVDPVDALPAARAAEAEGSYFSAELYVEEWAVAGDALAAFDVVVNVQGGEACAEVISS